MDARAAIESARRIKDEAQTMIANYIAQTICDVEDKTGLHVNRVTVHMNEVTSMNDYEPRYRVGGVEIELSKI